MAHVEVTAATTLVTTGETVVAVAESPQIVGPPPVPLAGGGVAPVIVSGVLNVTEGAAGTAVVIRVRAGTLAAPGIIGQAPPAAAALIGNADTVTLAAAASASIPFEKYDTTGAQAYMVTAQQTAATGNGTVNSASMDATVQ